MSSAIVGISISRHIVTTPTVTDGTAIAVTASLSVVYKDGVYMAVLVIGVLASYVYVIAVLVAYEGCLTVLVYEDCVEVLVDVLVTSFVYVIDNEGLYNEM